MGELTQFIASGGEVPPKPEMTPEMPAEGADETLQREVLEEAVGEPKEEEAEEETSEETTQEAQPEAGEPAKAPQEKEQPAVTEFHEIKVDGKVSKVDLTELKRGYQLASASYKRLAEANQMTTQARGVIQRFIEDPLGAAEEILAGKLGGPEHAEAHLNKLMEQRLSKTLEEQSLPPEQQRVLWEKKRLEREKKQWEAEKARKEHEIQQHAAEQAHRQLDADIVAAIKEHELPADQVIWKSIAKQMLDYYNAGINLTASEAASMVKKERESRLQQLSEALSPDELIAKYPELVQKIREIDLNKVKSQTTRSGAAAKTQQATTKPSARRVSNQRVATVQEFRQLINKRL